MAATAALYQPGSFDGTDTSQSIIKVFFKITPSGTYTANGDALDLSVLSVPSSSAPIVVLIVGIQTTTNSGYLYTYIPGNPATQVNGKFQVLKGAAGPLVDIGAGAYPAAVTGDTIIGIAEFVKL
jgi:hypothetical protein